MIATPHYEIGPDGLWTGNVREALTGGAIPPGWTARQPPDLSAGERAFWAATGWTVLAAEEVENRAADAALVALSRRKLAMESELAQLRWEHETSGVLLDGAHIRTDPVSQAKLTGAVTLARSDPELVAFDWEAQPGNWVTLDGSSIVAIGIAVGRHVQACFSRARSLAQAIASAETHEALDAIDIRSGWPS